MIKIKVILNKIKYWFKVLNWAMKHTKEVENYKFLIKLRKTAYNLLLKMERENNIDRAKKLEIQIKLIDKILNYVKN